MLVAGIDPGIHGAIGVCDGNGKFVCVDDMPVWNMAIGKKMRLRIDTVALFNHLQWLKETLGVGLAVLEAVGGRPQQSASSGFVFGYSTGQVVMACVALRIPLETVPPQTWKKLLRLPGKQRTRTKGQDDVQKTQTDREFIGQIIGRTDEMFPEHTHEWRGRQGGYKLDRAEAVLLARFGVEHIVPRFGQPGNDMEVEIAYKRSDLLA